MFTDSKIDSKLIFSVEYHYVKGNIFYKNHVRFFNLNVNITFFIFNKHGNNTYL